MHWPDPDPRYPGGPGPGAGGREPAGHWSGAHPGAAGWGEHYSEYPHALGGAPNEHDPDAQLPGPRQEYLDAFDSGAPGASGPSEAGAAGGHGPLRGGGAGLGTEPVQPRPRTQPPAPPEPAPDGAGAAEPDRRHSWSRTVTGLLAVAVVAVLTADVHGQMVDDRGAEPAEDGAAAPPADGEPGSDGGSTEKDAAGEDGAEPDGQADDEALERVELSYGEAMGTVFDLDPELTGSGELVPVPGSDPAAFDGAGVELRYRVDVEEDLGLDPEVFAEAVHTTLNDPRGWHNNGERSFSRVESGSHDFVITLASPGTTHEWCDKADLDTEMDNVSCDSATTDRVMINAWRWAQGAETYGEGEIHAYRQMLINHEVGHRIGYGHATCPAEGALAPVMMQQTKFLTTDGVRCEPNSWPHPANG